MSVSSAGDNFGGRGGSGPVRKRGVGGGFAALNAMRAPFQRKGKRCPIDDVSPADFSYKNIKLLRSFTSSGGRILSRRVTGVCAKHQRQIALNIKRARIMALMPFCC